MHRYLAVGLFSLASGLIATESAGVQNSLALPVTSTTPTVRLTSNAEATSPKIPETRHLLALASQRLTSVFSNPEAASRWTDILNQLTGDEQEALAFLITTMPVRDLRELTPAFVLQNIKLALAARREFSWARDIPRDLFLNDVVPYAVLDETREAWRADLMAKLRPIVAACKTRREAILAVNAALKGLTGVEYNTKRKAPNQSPAESIQQGVASCTGLSILLVDAFRAVGIPARVAGCATWVTVQGNHNWVEVWDNAWHFTEYYPDAKGLNHSWFLERAAYADPERPETRIYASSWVPTGQAFPLVWNYRQRDVQAIERTSAYHAWAGGRKFALSKEESLLGVRVFQGEQREATEVTLSQGGKELKTVRTAGPEQDMADVPWIRVRLADGPVTLRYGSQIHQAELKGGEETVVDLRLEP